MHINPMASASLGLFGAQVLTPLINVSYNAQMEAFTASFLCYVGWILGISWSFGSFGVFWSPFGGLLGGYGALLDLFGDNLGLS